MLEFYAQFRDNRNKACSVALVTPGSYSNLKLHTLLLDRLPLLPPPPPSLSSVLLDISLLLLPPDLEALKNHFARDLLSVVVRECAEEAVNSAADACNGDERLLKGLAALRLFLWPRGNCTAGGAGVIKEEGELQRQNVTGMGK